MEEQREIRSAADEVNDLALANDVAKTEKVDAGNYYFSDDKRFQFVEKSFHERGFGAFFAQNVKPDILKLERARLQRVKWLAIRAAILLSIVFAAKSYVLPVIGLEEYDFQYYIIGFILSLMIAAHPDRSYKADYKTIILPKVLKFFKTLSYNVDGKIPAERLQNSDILPPHTRYDSEDMIYGSYNGMDITITEVRLANANDKNHKTNKFSGLFIVIDTKLPFKGKTLIRKDMGFRKQWMTGKTQEKQQVPLIEDRFSKRLKVYTTDIDEANKIISPALLETFLHLSGRFKNTIMEGCFYEDKLFITLPCDRNLFEPASIFMPAYDIKDLRLLIEEISLIFKLIDTIKGTGKTL